MIRYSDQEKVSRVFVSILRGPAGDLNPWRARMRGMVRQIEMDGVDVDFVDIDLLFAACINGFQRSRREVQQALKREFLKATGQVEADLTFDQFNEIVKEAHSSENWKDSIHTDPLVKFSGNIGAARSFILAQLATPKNNQYVGAV